MPVDNLFPRSTPHWDYDLEKSMLLSCNFEASSNTVAESNTLTLGLSIGLGLVAVIAITVAMVYVKKSKDLEAKYVKSETGVQA